MNFLPQEFKQASTAKDDTPEYGTPLYFTTQQLQKRIASGEKIPFVEGAEKVFQNMITKPASLFTRLFSGLRLR